MIDPECRGPDHKGRGLRIVKATQFCFKTGTADAVTRVQPVRLAEVADAQQQIGETGMIRQQSQIPMRLNNGLEFRAGEGALDGGNGQKESIDGPGQNKLGPRIPGAEIILEPAFLLLVCSCVGHRVRSFADGR